MPSLIGIMTTSTGVIGIAATEVILRLEVRTKRNQVKTVSASIRTILTTTLPSFAE